MENTKINDRLLTAVPFVRSGMRFCDIGTDHAYLPIYLIKNGKIDHAIAADINKGPLDKADENICKYGLRDQIDTVLSDGLRKISSDSVDDIAVFGMGGELIVKIIDEAPWVQNEGIRLILQPMTHPEKVREYLASNGYRIIGEALSLDRGKIYQTICAEYDGVPRSFDAFVLQYGEYILEKDEELLHLLMENDKKKLIRKIDGKQEGNEDASFETQMLNEIENYLAR